MDIQSIVHLARHGQRFLRKETILNGGTPVYFTRAQDGKLFSLEQISASDYNFSENIQTGQIISEEYLKGLYLDGLKAYVRKDWEKAVKRFEAIFILRRDYEDVQEKLIEMRQQLQNNNKGVRDDLKDLYFNALKAMVNGAWLDIVEDQK